MKTINRNRAFRFTIIFFSFFLFLVGCKKYDDYQLEKFNKDEQTIKVFSQVGIIHNRAMDYVYEHLRGIADSRNTANSFNENEFEISLREINEITTRYIIDSLNATGFSDYTAYYTKDTLIKEDNFSVRQFSQHVDLVLDTSISAQLSNAMNGFEVFWRDDNLNTQYYKYDSIINAVVPTLNNQIDKEAFTSAVSTAKYSLQYWDNNKEKWDRLVSDLGGDRNRVSNLVAGPGKGIIYADIVGGLGGLIRGATVGAAGGTVAVPGIGTVAGATAGGLVGAGVGGVGGSALEATHSLIKWVINW